MMRRRGDRPSRLSRGVTRSFRFMWVFGTSRIFIWAFLLSFPWVGVTAESRDAKPNAGT